jgi:spectrin alpha
MVMLLSKVGLLDFEWPNQNVVEYMGFMINKETENVRSSDDITSAFRALSRDLRPYVSAEEVYAVSKYFILLPH